MAKEKGGKKALAPKIEKEAAALALPLVEEAGFKLWDVCFEKEGAMWYLRVLFENKEGESDVDSERCEEVSKPINELFDKQSFIEHIDILEIGTPGVYRRLRASEHFHSFLGERVRAQVKSEKGESFIIGILNAYDEEQSQITIDDKNIKLKACIKINAEPLTLWEIEETDTSEDIEEIRDMN